MFYIHIYAKNPYINLEPCRKNKVHRKYTIKQHTHKRKAKIRHNQATVEKKYMKMKKKIEYIVTFP